MKINKVKKAIKKAYIRKVSLFFVLLCLFYKKQKIVYVVECVYRFSRKVSQSYFRKIQLVTPNIKV